MGPLVLHAVRQVGPSSMPWNDLYGPSRSMAPGMSAPPVEVSPFGLDRLRRKQAPCGPVSRTYFKAGVFSAFWYVRRIEMKSRRQQRQILLHIHSPNLVLLAVLAWVLLRHVKLVFTLHGEWQRFGAMQRAGLYFIASVCSRFVCVSDAAAQALPVPVARRLVRGGRLVCIRNGIPTKALDQDYPVASMENQRSGDVVVVSRLVAVKNTALVLEVFSRLKYSGRLIWYGSGSQDEVVELAGKLGVLDRLVLMGNRPRSEVMNALEAGSVYLGCSISEGLPVAALEAAAMGCRPFLSAIPSHIEVAGIVGLPTFDLRNPAEWANAVDDYLAAPSKASPKATELARRAREAFDLERTVRQHIEMYTSLEATSAVRATK